ncbi:MAG: indolepyruvate ferredoxin oxidoreductase subunit alpha, partial [Candidatus Eisenbacteria sp.]|nr:indolepyruvate ferredoxin oxidoreductase subunit alpha [Candidatus Eisenbacteria bacterium]
TAMTGHQQHPGTGMTLMGEPTTKLDYIELAKSMGVKDARRVDAFDMEAVKTAIKEATDNSEASLIVVEGPCALLDRSTWGPALEVNTEDCTACGMCLRLGCPAISKDRDGKSTINPIFCVGELCSMCAQVCPVKCIAAPVEAAV